MGNQFSEQRIYLTACGKKIGKVPRKIPLRDLNRLGHPSKPLAAIRAKCLDCCQGSKGEVRKCVVFGCPVWPMRMGHNPFHGQIDQPKKTPAALERSEVNEIPNPMEIHNDT